VDQERQLAQHFPFEVFQLAQAIDANATAFTANPGREHAVILRHSIPGARRVPPGSRDRGGHSVQDHAPAEPPPTPDQQAGMEPQRWIGSPRIREAVVMAPAFMKAQVPLPCSALCCGMLQRMWRSPLGAPGGHGP
jgi:hypothetical protein